MNVECILDDVVNIYIIASFSSTNCHDFHFSLSLSLLPLNYARIRKFLMNTWPKSKDVSETLPRNQMFLGKKKHYGFSCQKYNDSLNFDFFFFFCNEESSTMFFLNCLLIYLCNGATQWQADMRCDAASQWLLMMVHVNVNFDKSIMIMRIWTLVRWQTKDRIASRGKSTAETWHLYYFVEVVLIYRKSSNARSFHYHSLSPSKRTI